jgi:hypothetical protein
VVSAGIVTAGPACVAVPRKIAPEVLEYLQGHGYELHNVPELDDGLRIPHGALERCDGLIVRSGIVDGGPLAGWGFVEMDFVDGESLQRAPADPGVVERLAGLAEALDLLHVGWWSEGVPLVHRDVKPANLMVDRRGIVRILDFGIARVNAEADPAIAPLEDLT